LLQRALEIDPSFAPAYSFLARLEIEDRIDLAAAARLFQRALDLDPALMSCTPL
jgi:Tfp pilus assembly protein PilF